MVMAIAAWPFRLCPRAQAGEPVVDPDRRAPSWRLGSHGRHGSREYPPPQAHGSSTSEVREYPPPSASEGARGLRSVRCGFASPPPSPPRGWGPPTSHPTLRSSNGGCGPPYHHRRNPPHRNPPTREGGEGPAHSVHSVRNRMNSARALHLYVSNHITSDCVFPPLCQVSYE